MNEKQTKIRKLDRLDRGILEGFRKDFDMFNEKV